MGARLVNILTFTNLAAGASSAQAHQLVLPSGLTVIPDLVEFDNPAFDMVSCTSTILTVINRGGVTGTSNVRVVYDHTIQRAYSNIATTQLTPAPFVARGSSGVAGFEAVAGQMANLAGAQTIQAGQLTEIEYSATDFTTGGTLVDPANNRFNIPISGFYAINATIGWASIGTGSGTVDLDVFVNAAGTVVTYITLVATNNARSMTAVTSRSLVAGDTVSFRTIQNTGGPWDIIIAEATIYRIA